MPYGYRRRYRRRYAGRRSTYRRKQYKRRIVKKAFRKVSRVSGMSVKLRVQVPVLTDTNGNFSFALYLNETTDTNPSTFRSIVTATDATGFLQSFPLLDSSSFNALYESVRCTYAKYRFIPRLPNNTSATTVFVPLYHSWDWDGHRGNLDPSSVTVSTLLDETKTWEKNLYLPFKWRQRTISYKALSKFPPQSNLSQAPAGYWHSTNDPASLLPHLIGIIRDGQPTTNYGTMVFTIYCFYKDRR